MLVKFASSDSLSSAEGGSTPDIPAAVSHSSGASAIAAGNACGPAVEFGASEFPALISLRETMKARGARGITGIGRKFKIMDDDGSKSLSQSEFKKCLQEHQIALTDSEFGQLYRYFDADNSGSVDYDEFLIGLRGQLNDRRRSLVALAFGVIDADGSGTLELDDIVEKYDTSKHPDVIAGKKSKSEVLREFLDTFDGGDKDGVVTPREFERYYANISASVDDDDYFELMIRNAWHISGGEGWCANSTNRRVLVTHEDGRESVEEIKNDIGIAADNTAAMKTNLRGQGVSAVKLALYGEAGDTDKKGVAGSRPATAPEGGRRQAPASPPPKRPGASSIVFG